MPSAESIATLAQRIDALLPQTQCTRCGYDGCWPYAEAVACNEAAINQCPPGGRATINALADLLRLPPLPLNPANGVEAEATIAVIDEALCIGCFKCVLACPVDAIVGAPKLMHTVLGAECSGCDLCLPPCPVNCITMVPREATLPAPATQAPHWRASHDARAARLVHERESRDVARQRRRAATLQDQAQGFDITAAIARSRARKEAGP